MTEDSSPGLEDLTTRMKERHCSLVGRQKYLREKITTMERSIPALMAYNMWMAGQNCQDAPYCKIREIMNKFSPDSDPTEKLLESLKKTVKELNGETADLHEKIIDADVKLEEADMELESLELANNEMSDTLNNLEKEVRSYTTPSLHSIHSEDLICLTKIRQLAKEELNLKNCIKELEKKEMIFREQMDQLLAARDCQTTCGNRRAIRCMEELDCMERKVRCLEELDSMEKKVRCVPQMRKKKLHQPKSNPPEKEKEEVKEKEKEKEKEEKKIESKEEIPQETTERKSSWISNWWSSNQKAAEAPSGVEKKEESVSTNTEKIPKEENVKQCICLSPHDKKELATKKVIGSKSLKPLNNGCLSLSCKPCGHPVALPRGAQCLRLPCNCNSPLPRNAPCMKLSNGLAKSKMTCLKSPLREPRIGGTSDLGFRQLYKQNRLRPITNCRCNCKGKCSRGLSSVPCNCGAPPLCPFDKGYQPLPSKPLSNFLTADSNSEEEFCECCSCDCNDSDISLSCKCD